MTESEKWTYGVLAIALLGHELKLQRRQTHAVLVRNGRKRDAVALFGELHRQLKDSRETQNRVLQYRTPYMKAAIAFMYLSRWQLRVVVVKARRDREANVICIESLATYTNNE